MELTCKYCGCIFNAKPSAVKKGKKYCSKKCQCKAQFKGEIKHCATCGKEIKVSPSLVKENNFCCNTCRLTWLSKYVTENVNIAGHSMGHKAPHLTKLNKDRNPKLAIEPDAAHRGKYNKYEHKKIMEEALGRKLRPNESVHHINGIHDDNRLENLLVLDRNEHLRLHWQLAREKGVI